jgi:RAP domain
LKIDIASVNQKIAIEIDGPGHFVTCIDDTEIRYQTGTVSSTLDNDTIEYHFVGNGCNKASNGATILKQRLLSLLGWKVLRVPYWEWHALAGDRTREDQYCRDLLRK